jgi:type I restriction enzyme, S subunit
VSDQNWQEVKLGDIAEYVTVGYVGPMAHEYLPAGIPFLRSQDIKPYRIDFTDITYISDTFHEKIKKSALRPGDVVIVRTGRPGTSAVIPETLPISNCSDMVVVRPGSNLDSRYLCYYINSIAQDHVLAYSVGAVQQHYNVGSAKDLTLLLPPLPEQRAIAQILGALDDKIELNRRMNHILEEIERALFKSWFVDFDPVTAKAEGRAPFGMNAETASLFPAEFEETTNEDFAEIPKGWKLGTFGDIANNIRRSVIPKNVNSEMPYIGLEHMPRRSIALNEWGRAGNVTSNKFALKKDEVLFGKLRPYFHKVGVAPLDGVCSTDVLVVSPKSPEHFGLMLGHISSVDFVNFVDAASEGTKMPRTNWETMARFAIVIPDERLSEAFTKKIVSMIKKIHSNIFESRSLASIRDALLPQLLSGELRVQQVEKVIENI